jgi:hypothetical protein
MRGMLCARLRFDKEEEEREREKAEAAEEVFEVRFVVWEDVVERFEISFEASLMTERVFVSKLLSFCVFCLFCMFCVFCLFKSDRIISILLLSSSRRRSILRIAHSRAILALEAAKASAAWRITSMFEIFFLLLLTTLKIPFLLLTMIRRSLQKLS